MKLIDYINESLVCEAQKDIDRINNIIARAKGDKEKEAALAKNMAKSIKDANKALARYEAACEVTGENSVISLAFAEKCIEFGLKVGVTKPQDTPTKRGGFYRNTKSGILSKFSARCKKAYDEYTRPTKMFDEGEKLKNYHTTLKNKPQIVFDNPWSMILWEQDIKGQISDGMWENSSKYNTWWQTYNSLESVFKSNPKYTNDYPGPDVTKILKYVTPLQFKFQEVVWGKIYNLNNKKLLNLITGTNKSYGHKYQVYDLILNDDYEEAKAQEICDVFGIDLNDFMVFLACPVMDVKQIEKFCKKGLQDAKKAMRDINGYVEGESWQYKYGRR